MITNSISIHINYYLSLESIRVKVSTEYSQAL